MEPIVSSETSTISTQTPGNYPKRNKLQYEQFFIYIHMYIMTITAKISQKSHLLIGTTCRDSTWIFISIQTELNTWKIWPEFNLVPYIKYTITGTNSFINVKFGFHFIYFHKILYFRNYVSWRSVLPNLHKSGKNCRTCLSIVI